MPDYTALAQIPTPTGPEANVVPADLKRLAQAVDWHLNLYALDEADRNARYDSAPVGTVVYCTTRVATWQRAVAGWNTLHQSVPHSDYNPIPQANWDDAGCYFARDNRTIQVYLSMTYTGVSLNATASGHLADIPVAQLIAPVPYPLWPITSTYRMGNGSGGLRVSNINGIVYMIDAYPNMGISQGDVMGAHLIYVVN